MPIVEMESRQVVIIGAGPSGAIAAALLKRKGHDVLVIERQHFPRFSIGESLLSHCLDFVEEAGMLDAVNAAGFQRKTGAAFAWGERYSAFDFGDTFTNGKPTTFQVQRAEFDKLLADQAALQGAEIRYGDAIVSVDFDRAKPQLDVRREDGSEYRVEADFVLDASGYGRVLSRLLDLEAPSNFPVRQAVFTHVEDHIDNPAFDREKSSSPRTRSIAISGSGPSRSAMVAARSAWSPLPNTSKVAIPILTPVCAVSSPKRQVWPACSTTPCGIPRRALSAATQPTSKPCTARALRYSATRRNFSIRCSPPA